MTNTNADINSYKKPYYTIYFKASMLGLEIRLNDMPVFSTDNTGNMSLELPASEYISNGVNKLKVTTFPYFDDDDNQTENYLDYSNVTIGLYVREDGSPEDSRQLITEVTITPTKAYQNTDNSDVAKINSKSIDIVNASIKLEKDAHLLDYPVYGNYKKQVVTSWNTGNIKTPFPEWEWQQGMHLDDSKDTYVSLLNEYKILHKIYHSQDLNKLKAINLERSKELSIAYYLKNPEAGFEYSSVGKFINHPRAELFEDLNTQNTRLVIYGDGKLASIRSASSVEPVVFVDQEEEQVYIIHNIWYKTQSGNWVIIR